MEYSYYCFNANHCFGSTGLRKQDYCILNKQYEKAGFETLRNTIISDMKARGEYGEFFPARLSAFGYNESAAQEQFPVTKEQALAQGFKWEDAPRGTFGKETVQWKDVPDSINDLSAIALDPAKEIFACVACSKNYRIIPGELAFYKRFSIPLPRLCPDCRHARRFAARGPNRLFSRACSCAGARSKDGRYANTVAHVHRGDAACTNQFQTNYLPEYKGIVYCEQCYQAEVA